MEPFNVYTCDGDDYYLVKDLMTHKKGFKSETKFIEAMKYTAILYGRICIDDKTVKKDSVRSKKFSKSFVSVNQVNDEIKPRANKRIDSVEIIDLPKELDQNEFCFFKDSEGTEHDVRMYGERNKDKIFFSLKDVERVFELSRLEDILNDANSSFIYKEHFIKSLNRTFPISQWELENKKIVTLLTFKGLLKVINDCKKGRGKEFLEYLETIIFSTIAGSVEQRTESINSLCQGKLDLFKEVFGKHTGDVACLYILKTGLSERGLDIYKYGFTKNLDKRVKQHIKTFGQTLELEYFCFIDIDKLSAAEVELADCLSSFNQKSSLPGLETQTELLFLNSSRKKNVKSVMESIYKQFHNQSLGSINELIQNYKDKITKLESEIAMKDYEHKLSQERLANELHILRIESTSQLKEKDTKIEHMAALHKAELELISLKLEITEMKLNSDLLCKPILKLNN